MGALKKEFTHMADMQKEGKHKRKYFWETMEIGFVKASKERGTVPPTHAGVHISEKRRRLALQRLHARRTTTRITTIKDHAWAEVCGTHKRTILLEDAHHDLEGSLPATHMQHVPR